MPIQLKNPNGPYPPGWFAFSDPHTAMQFDDDLADLNLVVARVIEHRKANPSIYPPSNAYAFDPGSVAEQVIVQVCSRNPELCEDSALVGIVKQPTIHVPLEMVIPRTPRPDGKQCSKCGGDDFDVVVCRGCGGRITGYKCKKCGTST